LDPRTVQMLLKAILLYSAIFSGLMILGSLFWRPDFPWITFAIVGAFFLVPWNRWVVPLVSDPKRRITGHRKTTHQKD
jgi:hypothetical protein